MTREAYQKHKDVMEWFYAEEGRSVLGSWGGVRPFEVLTNPDWLETSTYIPNDEYVEFRKAQAEGKPLQISYKDTQRDMWGPWYDKFKLTWRTYHPSTVRIRIKPDEPEFKVGDWVRRKSEVFHKIDIVDKNYRLKYSTEKLKDTIKDDCELWEPQEGDVVVCWTNGKLVREIIKLEMADYEMDFESCQAIDFIRRFDNCIPYIGQDFKDIV